MGLIGRTALCPGEMPPLGTLIEWLLAISGDHDGRDDHPRPDLDKEQTQALDPEMSSMKKKNNRYFGMKLHIGTDVQTVLFCGHEATMAKVPDIQVWDQLLHGVEKPIRADKGCASAERWKTSGAGDHGS